MKYLFFLTTSLGFAMPALALDEGSGGASGKGIIVVTATRTDAPLAEVGQSVSIVTREEIERSQVVQAAELLARLPGLSVSPSGGFGQPTSLFVRGADNAQSLVMIDGVRINDPADVGGGFDFGGLGSEATENLRNDALFLGGEGGEEVLAVDLLVGELFRHLLRLLHGFLGLCGETL